MGVGKAGPSESLRLSPGSTAWAWGPVLELVASAIGVQLERIEDRHEVLIADQDVPIASGTVPEGTISGMRFEIIGVVDGEERIVVEHVTRLRDDAAPDWPEGHGYRLLIEGEQRAKVELMRPSD